MNPRPSNTNEERLGALNSDLLDALRDVVATCGPFSPRGGQAMARAKALIRRIDEGKQ